MLVSSNQYRTFWRLAAVGICLVWIIVTLVYTVFTPAIHHSDENIIAPPVQYILYGASIIGSGILVFFPLQFYLYAGFCCAWALIHIIDGGRVLGILLYVLGLSFAFKQGCFKTFPKVKGLLSSLFLLAAMVSQVRYGMPYVMETLMQCLAFCIILGLGVLLFIKDVSISNEAPVGISQPTPSFSVIDSELRLSASYFTSRDVLILQRLLAGDKYDLIAEECGMGLSTLKKLLASLFSLLALSNKTQFLKRYAHHTVMLIPDTVSEPSCAHIPRSTIIRFHRESS
jgi:DNA-binding CsgD family transcriptional regulator